jgi:NhaA family Na+:H+ antiporter
MTPAPDTPHYIDEPNAVARRLRQWLDPFQQFAQTGSLGSVVLLGCTIAALGWANSPWADSYFDLWRAQVAIGSATAPLTLSLQHWINDGLMAVFFLLVGLEIKRELLVGELSSLRQASLPIVAALGGMIVPALLYLAMNTGSGAARGWGIPMATDIAFALGVLQLMGSRCPIGLKIFLTALAIIDDLGAILVIALFYTDQIAVPALLFAGAALALLVALNKLRVRVLMPYLLVGIVLWLAVLSSGIHATIAGVLVALAIPVRTRINAHQFSVLARQLIDEFDETETGDSQVITSRGQQRAIHAIESASEAVQAPLLRLEHALAPLVSFAILPLFALANAGVSVAGARAPWASTVGFGVLLGLLIGKPLGIMLFSWLAIQRGWATLPRGVGWKALGGAAWLGGIGFTMALFIAELAFGGGERLDEAKLGILLASVLAGTIGWWSLRRALKPATESPVTPL